MHKNTKNAGLTTKLTLYICKCTVKGSGSNSAPPATNSAASTAAGPVARDKIATMGGATDSAVPAGIGLSSATNDTTPNLLMFNFAFGRRTTRSWF
jgi:hypothetical protein